MKRRREIVEEERRERNEHERECRGGRGGEGRGGRERRGIEEEEWSTRNDLKSRARGRDAVNT